MSSDSNRATDFLNYLKLDKNERQRHLLQKAFEEALIAAGALAGFHFSAEELKVGLQADDVIGGGWHP